MLVEQAEFPRVKVCGECISPAAAGMLQTLLPPPVLETLGARSAAAYVLECGERTITWPTPRATLSLSRAALDSALLEEARRAGACIMQPASVARVEYAEGGALLTLGDGRILACGVVLHADGSGRHDPRGAVGNRRGVIGCKCHIRMQAGGRGDSAKGLHHNLRAVHMRSAPGAYIGVVGVEGRAGDVRLHGTLRAAGRRWRGS